MSLLVENYAGKLLYLVLAAEDLLVERDAVELLYLALESRGSPSSRK